MALDKTKFDDRQLIELIYDELEHLQSELRKGYATKAELESVFAFVQTLEKRVEKNENIFVWTGRVIGAIMIAAILGQIIITN